MKNDYECQTKNGGRSFGSKVLEGILLAGSAVIVLFLLLIFLAVLGSQAQSAPPDPWVRMTSPSGCSGGVFHASREYGVWIATCKHCVNRPGRVRLVFFKDGQRANVDGQFVRSHRRYDCAVVWVSADHFYELPAVVQLATPDIGPFVGQAVYAVGSYAGGTITPAVRHLSIKSVRSGAYEFILNDDAWGGHSGGPVICATTGRLLGNLWGTRWDKAAITSNRALFETLYGTWATERSTGQGLYAVHDPIEQLASKPDVKVSANRRDIDRIKKEVRASHFLDRHFDFDFDTDWFRKTPRVEWKIDGKKWYYDGWTGQDGFISQYQQTGGTYY